MPRGTEHPPKITTKLTAVSMSCRGKKVNVFIHLPVIEGKTVMSQSLFNAISKELEAERGDTISHG